jgi:hypothetical protein
MLKKLHFDRSHGDRNEVQTPQDRCTSLLSTKVGDGIGFQQKQEMNDGNETLLLIVKARCTTTIG